MQPVVMPSSTALRRFVAFLLMLCLSLQVSLAAPASSACSPEHAAVHEALAEGHATHHAAAPGALCDEAAPATAASHEAADCDHCAVCGTGVAAITAQPVANAVPSARADRLAPTLAHGWASVSPEPLHRPPIIAA